MGEFFATHGVPSVAYEPATPSYTHAAGYVRASWRLARDLRRQQVDLLHCADLLAAHYAGLAGRLARIPVLCHIRNRFERVSGRDCSFLWPVSRFAFVSRNTWEYFGCQVAPSRGVVVYDGIDIPALAEPDQSREVRRELGLPDDARVIGMLARVAPQKDYPTLIRAAERVLRVEPRARFLVVGDRESTPENRTHYEEVRRAIDERGVGGAFLFTGQRRDVPRLLDAIDIFVLSTHWEGLPLVILEAMAHGKPVVATGVDGIPEVVRHGETGLLAAHADDEQLAAHLMLLLTDRSAAARLGAAGRDHVQRHFSREQFAASMDTLYREMLGA